MSDGPTGSVESLHPISLDSLTGGTPPPPVLLLADLLSDVSVLQQQEASDSAKFGVVASPDIQGFRTKLIPWVAGGYQGPCDLIRIPFATPNVCSDGVVRNLFEYIQFVSGKSIVDHIASIQSILPDFEVGYRCSRNELVFCVVSVKA